MNYKTLAELLESDWLPIDNSNKTLIKMVSKEGAEEPIYQMAKWNEGHQKYKVSSKEYYSLRIIENPGEFIPDDNGRGGI